MIKLNNVDIESYIKSINPSFGFESEYYENKMISGKIRRDYRGKRFKASIKFPYLTQEQVNYLFDIIKGEEINAQISTAVGLFQGNVFANLNSSQTRFAFINNNWVWVNYELTLNGVDLID